MARQLSENELIRRGIEGRLLDVRTSFAGEVVSFDANTMTATVRPGVRVQVTDPDSIPEVDTLPDLEGVPVLYPQGSGFICYFPLEAGDPVRIEASEEDDGEFYDDEGADVPVNPTVLVRHGGQFVCRPEGTRGAGKLGSESEGELFIGKPGGVCVTTDGGDLILGRSDGDDPVVRLSDLEAVVDKFNNHTHSTTAVTGGGGPLGVIAKTANTATATASDVVKAK